MLKGHGLENFIKQKKHINQKHIVAFDVEGFDEATNCELAYWEKQDQLLLGWLHSTISQSILSHVIGLSITFDIWNTLEARYALHCSYRL